jgi:FkbH-like protein
MTKNLNLLETIKFSKKNNSNATVDVISSFNFDYYKYFFNANFFKKNINLKINKTYTNQLKLNMINYPNNSKSELWIFIDWSDLIPSSSLRLESVRTEKINLKFNKKNQDELIKIILQISKKTKKILVFAPHTVLLNDCILSLNFANRLESLSTWNIFVQKIKKKNNIKIVNKDFNSYSICTESLFRSNTPINLQDLENYTDRLSELFQKRVNKKLIITDLDDTLWRGTLGENGPHGVSWEKETNSFKHLYYQNMLREIHSNGKIIAIASKNEIINLSKVFKRKDFFLKKHFSSIQCSWLPKSQMISNILKELNLGEDSFLFIDNNKFELEEVKRNFPKAEYLLFPEENIDFIKFIKNFYKNFSLVSSEDDKLRNRSYEALKIINKNKLNLNEFLKKINMTCFCARVKNMGESRAFELINKTNQFNLNGTRIDEADKNKYFSKNYFIFKFSLKDKLADHGTIGVVIFKKQGLIFNIEHMVLSCRVFSRNAESVFLKIIINLAKQYKIKKVYFNYKKTLKNKLIKDFFSENLIKNNIINISKYTLVNKFLGKIKII